MVMQGIKYIQKEWDIIMSTPFTFIVMLIIACIVAYTASKWRYGKIVEISKAKYDFLKVRHKAKSAQLEEIIKDFKFKKPVQPEDNDAQNESIKTGLSFEIDRILKKLQDFWEKYQKISKDSQKYGGAIISKNPFTTTPAQFKHIFPELHQEVLKDTRLIEVREFYYKIKDIELVYKELRNQPKQDFELTFQWEALVAETIEQGNPLKEKP